MHEKDCECPQCFAIMAAIIDAGKVVYLEEAGEGEVIAGYMYATLHSKDGGHMCWSIRYNSKLEVPHLGYLSMDLQNIVKKETN